MKTASERVIRSTPDGTLRHGLRFHHTRELGQVSREAADTDYKAMLARFEYRANVARYSPHELDLVPGLPARAVICELQTDLPFRCV